MIFIQTSLYLLSAASMWAAISISGVIVIWTIITIMVYVKPIQNKGLLFDNQGIDIKLTNAATNANQTMQLLVEAFLVLLSPVIHTGQGGVLSRASTFLLCIGLAVVAFLVMEYHDKAFTFVDRAHKCYIYPWVNDVVFPVQNMIRIAWDAGMGVTLSSARIMSIYTTGWAGVLITCGGDNLRASLQNFGGFVTDFFVAYYNWERNPYTRFDGITPARSLGKFISSFNPVLTCLCTRLSPVWDLLTGAFSMPSFHRSVDSLINSFLSIFRIFLEVLANILSDDDITDDIGDENSGNEVKKDRNKVKKDRNEINSHQWANIKQVLFRAKPQRLRGAWPTDNKEGGSQRNINDDETFVDPPIIGADGRPLTGILFNNLCDTAVQTGDWLDDLVNSTFVETEIYFGGEQINLPRISCLLSSLFCAASAFAELIVDNLIRSDIITVDPDKARRYISFDNALSWFLVFASCINSVVSSVDVNLGCWLSSLVGFIVYTAFGILEILKAVGIGLVSGEDADEIVIDLANITHFDSANNQWLSFSKCMGIFVGEIFGSLGCLVEGSLVLLSAIATLAFSLLRFATNSFLGIQHFSAGYTAEWESHKYDILWDTISNIGECLRSTLDNMLGCIFTSIFLSVAQLIRLPFLVAYVGLSASARNESVALSFSNAWDDGVFTPSIDNCMAVVYCISSIVQLFSESTACAIHSLGDLAVALIKAIGTTANVFVKASIKSSDLRSNWSEAAHGEESGIVVAAKIFLEYYDEGKYNEVSNILSEMGSCIYEGGNSVSPVLGCLLRLPIDAIRVASSAIAFSTASIMRAVISGESLTSILGSYWMNVNPLSAGDGDTAEQSGPIRDLLLFALQLSACFGEIGSLLDKRIGCIMSNLSSAIVKLLWNIIDAMIRLLYGIELNSLGTPTPLGSLVFVAWDSGLYSTPIKELLSAASCLSSFAMPWSQGASLALYYSVAFACDSVLALVDFLVACAKSISYSEDFKKIIVAAWDAGKFSLPFRDFEMLAYWLFQTISPMNQNIADALSLAFVAFTRIIYNSLAVLIVSSFLLYSSTNASNHFRFFYFR